MRCLQSLLYWSSRLWRAGSRQGGLRLPGSTGQLLPGTLEHNAKALSRVGLLLMVFDLFLVCVSSISWFEVRVKGLSPSSTSSEAWSPAKKVWCCKEKGQGCQSADTVPACDAGAGKVWKKVFISHRAQDFDRPLSRGGHWSWEAQMAGAVSVQSLRPQRS